MQVLNHLSPAEQEPSSCPLCPPGGSCDQQFTWVTLGITPESHTHTHMHTRGNSDSRLYCTELLRYLKVSGRITNSLLFLQQFWLINYKAYWNILWTVGAKIIYESHNCFVNRGESNYITRCDIPMMIRAALLLWICCADDILDLFS